MCSDRGFRPLRLMTKPPHPSHDTTLAAGRRSLGGLVISASLLLAVLLFTAVVVGRGVGGHFEQSLSKLATFAVYLGLTLPPGLVLWLNRRTTSPPQTTGVDFVSFAAAAVIVICPLLAAMIVGRDLAVGMLVALWLLTVVIAGAAVWCLIQHESTSALGKAHQQQGPLMVAPAVEVAVKPSPAQPATTAAPYVSPVDADTFDPQPSEKETFSQRWTRRDGDIGDELEGTLKIFFANGQRTATADIPIVPAMASVPDVDCEPLSSEADVEVIVRSVHTYGVRLEVQRPADRTVAEEVELAVLIHAERSEE